VGKNCGTLKTSGSLLRATPTATTAVLNKSRKDKASSSSTTPKPPPTTVKALIGAAQAAAQSELLPLPGLVPDGVRERFALVPRSTTTLPTYMGAESVRPRGGVAPQAALILLAAQRKENPLTTLEETTTLRTGNDKTQ